ncbi:asparagine synthase-related protein [Streptomyces rhizosphaericus]|uniref:asparagine synthase-related protein n=1 Tax=Streptomyces rhizosphaericus TaxID=114699 RepID=UPI0031D4E1F4
MTRFAQPFYCGPSWHARLRKHFDGLEDPDSLPVTDLPSMSLGVLSMLAARLAPAVAHGSGAHLTGRGRDNVLAAPSSHRVDAFLAGRPFRRSVARTTSPMSAGSSRGGPGGSSPPPPPSPTPARWTGWPAGSPSRSPARGAWPRLTRWPGVRRRPLPAARWLTSAGRRAVSQLVAARVPHAVRHTAPGALHDRLDLEWMAAEHATFDAIARQRWGVPIHAPFLDTAVAATRLAIPPFERARPGVYKPLAWIALAHLVPHWLLARQTKTLFTTSVFDGLAANAPALRRVIDNSHLTGAGLLDARRAAADLESGIAGAPTPLGNLHALLVTELWLARLNETAAYAAWWQPAEGSTLCP